MTEVRSGLAPYIYVCTRMRVRKAKLLPKEEYLRMLQMSLPEITRFIEETEYKKEIDENAQFFEGIDLFEIGLSWNLAKEYQKILEITPGSLKQFTKAYLRRWDIQNVLNILRGKLQGMKAGKIKEVIIPAGGLDRLMLDRLIAEDSPERVIEALKKTRMYPVLLKEYPGAIEKGSFSKVENELYKAMYAEILSDAEGGIKGGNDFITFLRLDIDIINIKNIFRIRADGFEEDVKDMMIPGGSFTPDELQALNSLPTHDDFIDTLRGKLSRHPILEAQEQLRNIQSIREAESELTRIQLVQMERMSKMHPFSIHPILVYLEKKKYEVFNLRALARGKESGLSPERIKEFLVI